MIAEMDHGTLRQLAAGAALDDLDSVERDEFDGHLPSCGSCQDLTADLHVVVEDLAFAAPLVVPPLSMRTDVLTALRLQRSHVGAAPADQAPTQLPSTPIRSLPSPTAPARPSRMPVWASLGLAAALGIVAVGLGAQTARLTDQVAAAGTAAAEAQAKIAAREDAMALIGDPGHLAFTMHAEGVAPAASAFVVYRPGSTEAFLMATDLPPTPAGQVYQLWVADATGVHPLGTFHFDGQGAFVAPFGVDLGASAAAMVTLEPEGGAQGEPGPQVVFGET